MANSDELKASVPLGRRMNGINSFQMSCLVQGRYATGNPAIGGGYVSPFHDFHIRCVQVEMEIRFRLQRQAAELCPVKGIMKII